MLIVLRRMAAVAMALLSLICVLIIVFGTLGENRHPQHTQTPLGVPIFVLVTYAIVAALAAWASWVLFRRPSAQNVTRKIGRSAVEPWQLAEGEVFKRPWYSVPVCVFGLLLLAIIAPIGPLGIIAGLWTISTGSFNLALEMIGFGLLFFIPSVICFNVFKQNLKLGNSPIAIVGKAGITLPRRQPAYLEWSNIASIRAFNIGKATLLELVPVDPSAVFPRRRGWWHGPWRDRVTIRIGSTRAPIVEAAKRAHAAWHENTIST